MVTIERRERRQTDGHICDSLPDVAKPGELLDDLIERRLTFDGFAQWRASDDEGAAIRLMSQEQADRAGWTVTVPDGALVGHDDGNGGVIWTPNQPDLTA